MIDNGMFLLKRGCGALGLEEIAKNIQEKKDNDMAMEFTKRISELLKKNGVVPKMTEYTSRNIDTDKTFETRYGVSIDELDFSEHDKVFEDKIANLENQIAYMKEKNNYLRTRCMEDATDAFDRGSYGALTIVGRRVDLETENEKLKQRIDELEKELEEWKEEARVVKKQRDEQLKSFRKGIEPYVDLLHMHETIAELKQRIAELEIEQTEKQTKINLNDKIKVKLTPLGAEIYYHQYDELNKKIKKNGGTELEPIMPQIDEDGYTKFQLHRFINLYGEHIGMCKKNVIEPLYIVIAE